MKLLGAVTLLLVLFVCFALLYCIVEFFNANPPQWARYMLIVGLLWTLVVKH